MSSRIGPRPVRLIFVIAAIAVCFMLTATTSSGKAKRGDYPNCQEECVSELQRHMAELSEEYEKTGKILPYEERVEQVRSLFDDCIDNCKRPMPVK